MANIKVSELPSASSFEDNDYTMIVQSGENKKASKDVLLADALESVNNKIITRTFSKTNITINANSYKYETLSIPSVENYTIVSLEIASVAGAGSGYIQITKTLSGDLNIYNPTSSNVTISISFVATYIKN